MPCVLLDEIVISLLSDNVEPSGILKNNELGSLECMDWHEERRTAAKVSIINFIRYFPLIKILAKCFCFFFDVIGGKKAVDNCRHIRAFLNYLFNIIFCYTTDCTDRDR